MPFINRKGTTGMKRLCVATLAGFLLVSSVYAEDKAQHLFILSGQSNMARLKLDLTFTPAIEAEFGKDNVIIVKDAEGNQPIARWYKKCTNSLKGGVKKPGDLYDRLMTKVNTAIDGKKISSVTFVWMQGETDAKTNGDHYADSLRGLLDQLKGDLGREDLNFVIGRISDYNNPQKFPHWETIRKAQVEVAEADPRGVWIDTDDLNDGKDKKGKRIKDAIHYSVGGYKTLGTRFAEKAISLILK